MVENYKKGLGVEKSQCMAIKYFGLAAAQKHLKSINQLKRMSIKWKSYLV